MGFVDPRPPGPRTWRCEYSPDGTEVHLRPRHDHIRHILDIDCICGPTVGCVDTGTRVGWVVTHHALDARPGPEGGFSPEAGPCDRGNDLGDDGTETCSA